MALTKDDLQAIGALMDEKMDSKLAPIKKQLNKLEDGQQTLWENQKTMQGDMKTMQGDMKTVQGDMKTMQSDMKTMREKMEALRISQLRVENEWFPRINAALEGVIGNTEKLMGHGRRISSLEDKSDNHSVRISMLEDSARVMRPNI